MKKKQCGLGRANYFSGGFGIALPRMIFRPQGCLGRNAGGFWTGGFRKFGGY